MKPWPRCGDSGGSAHGFLHGALVLTAGMAVVKVLGALFKVPLTYAIGEYGIGLFNLAYHFYGPVFTLATAGFPLAVAQLVSESSSLGRWNDARQVKQVAMPLFLGVGRLGPGGHGLPGAAVLPVGHRGGPMPWPLCWLWPRPCCWPAPPLCTGVITRAWGIWSPPPFPRCWRPP